MVGYAAVNRRIRVRILVLVPLVLVTVCLRAIKNSNGLSTRSYSRCGTYSEIYVAFCRGTLKRRVITPQEVSSVFWYRKTNHRQYW